MRDYVPGRKDICEGKSVLGRFLLQEFEELKMALNTENFFEEWRQEKLPEKWQKKTDSFAVAPIHNSPEQMNFRAGFYIGMHLEQIKKEYGVEEEA